MEDPGKREATINTKVVTYTDIPFNDPLHDAKDVIETKKRTSPEAFKGDPDVAAALIYQMKRAVESTLVNIRGLSDQELLNPDFVQKIVPEAELYKRSDETEKMDAVIDKNAKSKKETYLPMALADNANEEITIAYQHRTKKIVINTEYLSSHSKKDDIDLKEESREDTDGTKQILLSGKNGQIMALKAVRETVIAEIYENEDHNKLVPEDVSYKGKDLQEIDAIDMNWAALIQQLKYANKKGWKDVEAVLQNRFDNAKYVRELSKVN